MGRLTPGPQSLRLLSVRVSTQKYVSGVKGSSFNKYRRLQGKAGPQPGREATGDLDESGFGGQTVRIGER